MVRLQKFLSEAGLASRRSSEQLIVAGRVEINGRKVRELGTKVDPVGDRVSVDGRPVKPRRKRYVALNKPRGYISSRNDPLKRKCIADLLPKEWSDLYSVGRLDYESEGLLFLTNDGEFCLRLTHPRYGVRKIYLVTVEGRLEPRVMRQLTQGVSSQGERLKAERARVLTANASQSVAEIELVEGKNREIRRMFETLGWKIDRLRRTQIGRIKIGELPSGKWRTLNPSEVTSLLSNGVVNPRVQSQEH